MTNVVFFKNKDDIIGFTCKGHTGYGVEGQDILCASISSITQSAVMGLTQVLNLDCKYKINSKKGSLECWLPNIENPQVFSNAQALLKTAYVALKDLEQGFPSNIKVEVKN